jgi:hypothetical protein
LIKKPVCPAFATYNDETQKCDCPTDRPYSDGYECFPCDLPNFWNTDKNTCDECDSGLVYNTNTKKCQLCPIEKPIEVDGKCLSCPDESHFDFDSGLCISCSEGSYFDKVQNKCLLPVV